MPFALRFSPAAYFVDLMHYVETILVGRRIPHTMSGNIQVGVLFLRQMLREFKGDVRKALAGYVQGPTSLRTRGPLAETRFYVEGVLAQHALRLGGLPPAGLGIGEQGD